MYNPENDDSEYEDDIIEEERKNNYEGPGGGAFQSWADFWSWKEG